MPKVSPNDSFFAEPLCRRSERISDRVKHDDGTDPASPWPQNVDSHRTTLVIPFEHIPLGRTVLKDRLDVSVEVRNFGRFWNFLVMVTQSAQLIQNSCSFSFINRTLLQNLNPRLKVDLTKPLEDLPRPNDLSLPRSRSFRDDREGREMEDDILLLYGEAPSLQAPRSGPQYVVSLTETDLSH